MTRIIRPGVPVPTYRVGLEPSERMPRPTSNPYLPSEPVLRPSAVRPLPKPYTPRPVGPRPGYTPPVRHEHGSRRQEQYRVLDRTAVTESLESTEGWWEREQAKKEAADARWRETNATMTRARLGSDAAVRELRIRLSGDDPAKVITHHITPAHRVQVFDLARVIGLTSAQVLLLVNKQFGEYAKTSQSSIASIVATRIIEWVASDEATEVIAAVREGKF